MGTQEPTFNSGSSDSGVRRLVFLSRSWLVVSFRLLYVIPAYVYLLHLRIHLSP